jgi:hypothetical protein
MTIVDFGFLIGKRKNAPLGQFKNQQSEIINHQSSIINQTGVRGQRASRACALRINSHPQASSSEN